MVLVEQLEQPVTQEPQVILAHREIPERTVPQVQVGLVVMLVLPARQAMLAHRVMLETLAQMERLELVGLLA